MTKVQSLFWSAAPFRALAEAWLLCAVLLIPVYPAVINAPPYPRSLYLLLLPLACAVLAGLRMRLPSGPWWRAILQEIALALLLCLVIFGMVFGLLSILGAVDALRTSYAGRTATAVFLWFAGLELLGVRAGSWALQRWNDLRRRRFVWALTHASISVVGGVGMTALIIFLIVFANRMGNDIWGIPPESLLAKTVFWATIFIVLAFLLVVVGLTLFLPPATLFSYLVARRLTARLEKLAETTLALRKGSLEARVPVQGEDEIAQLQADFNAMAADLETSMQDLQAEKDKVWMLMEARRELVAEVSHELRNPAAVILGYSDALRRGWKERSPEEVERDLETIQYEALRLQTILDDLLTAAQVEAGKLRVEPCAVDASTLAQRLVETFSGLAWERKRVQVSLSTPDEPVHALADPLRLEQVLANLMQNAVRHTSPGGLVTLAVHQDKEQVHIEVEDTGEGISPEDLPHVWEKYYQAGSAQRRTESGAGLGLALVKELTEAMGGTVEVESCPGQGSSFIVHLPVYQG